MVKQIFYKACDSNICLSKNINHLCIYYLMAHFLHYHCYDRTRYRTSPPEYVLSQRISQKSCYIIFRKREHFNGTNYLRIGMWHSDIFSGRDPDSYPYA